ncbi:hypothetical protein V8F33_008695 [Rhypophila sp. PSN 637]
MPAIDINGGALKPAFNDNTSDGGLGLENTKPPHQFWVVVAVVFGMLILSGLMNALAVIYGRINAQPDLMWVDKVAAAMRHRNRPIALRFVMFLGRTIFVFSWVVTLPVRFVVWGLFCRVLSRLWPGCFGCCVGDGLVRAFMWGSSDGRVPPRLLSRKEGRHQVGRMFGLGMCFAPVVDEPAAGSGARWKPRGKINTSRDWVVGPNGEAIPPKGEYPAPREEEETVIPTVAPPVNVMETEPPAYHRIRASATIEPELPAYQQIHAPPVLEPEPPAYPQMQTAIEAFSGGHVRQPKSWAWVNLSRTRWMTAPTGESIAPGGTISADEYLRSHPTTARKMDKPLPLEELNLCGITTHPPVSPWDGPHNRETGDRHDVENENMGCVNAPYRGEPRMVGR